MNSSEKGVVVSMLEKKFAIFFDIDGTLYDHQAGVPEETMNTLYRLREEGYTLSLNTGRAKDFIPDELLAFPFDGFVTGNGTYVEYHGEVLQDIVFPASFTRFVYDEFEKRQIPFTIETKANAYMSAGMAAHTRKRFGIPEEEENSQAVQAVKSKYDIRNNMNEYSFENLSHKISFFGREDTRSYLRRFFENQAVVALEKPDAYGYSYGEAVPPGCNKSVGAAVLCCHAGIPYERVAAVGDGSNDVEIIRWAKYGIVMGNADEDLKRQGDFICKPFREGGIGELPEYLKKAAENNNN